MKWLRPDQAVCSIHDVDYAALWERGIRVLIFDLENTLCRWRQWGLDPRTRALLSSLRERGMRIAVLTNASIPPRQPFRGELADAEIRLVDCAHKPLRGGLRRALAALGAHPGEAALIGDQLLTDVLVGKRAGLYTVLVDPLGTQESGPTRFNRRLERILGRRGPSRADPDRR